MWLYIVLHLFVAWVQDLINFRNIMIDIKVSALCFEITLIKNWENKILLLFFVKKFSQLRINDSALRTIVILISSGEKSQFYLEWKMYLYLGQIDNIIISTESRILWRHFFVLIFQHIRMSISKCQSNTIYRVTCTFLYMFYVKCTDKLLTHLPQT